jgi:hypothetical protein
MKPDVLDLIQSFNSNTSSQKVFNYLFFKNNRQIFRIRYFKIVLQRQIFLFIEIKQVITERSSQQ